MPGYPGKDGLNEQQKRFYREWLIDYNATQAAKRAGYSEKTAHVQGCDLLKHPKGKGYIAELQREINEKLDFTAQDVLKELGKIGFSKIKKLFNDRDQLKSISQLDDDVAAAVESIEVVSKNVGLGRDVDIEHTHKIKLGNKIAALDKLAKHFDIYEKHQKSGAGEMTVIIKGKDSEL